jgi:hypothetical protein
LGKVTTTELLPLMQASPQGFLYSHTPGSIQHGFSVPPKKWRVRHSQPPYALL